MCNRLINGGLAMAKILSCCRETALQGALVLAKRGRLELELGDNTCILGLL